jgi:hypothetical protein
MARKVIRLGQIISRRAGDETWRDLMSEMAAVAAAAIVVILVAWLIWR